MSDTLTALSYSSLSTFRNCRQKYDWNYNKLLVPLQRDDALYFGGLIHKCLALWHVGRDIDAVYTLIDKNHAAGKGDDRSKRDRLVARSLMKAYAVRYHKEDFWVIGVEVPFEAVVRNPETGASSRTFKMKGTVDGIIRRGSDTLVFEHKTASQIDGGYLEKLWMDFQIILYSRYIERVTGERVDAVLYNVIAKPKIVQRQGETEAEYKVRYDELVAKSKSGKSSAKRQIPETDDEFSARLDEWYSDSSKFHRQEIIISRDQYDEIEMEVWELTQAMLGARSRGRWYKNTSMCFNYNKPCAYWAICSSGNNPNVINNMYQIGSEYLDKLNGTKEKNDTTDETF